MGTLTLIMTTNKQIAEELVGLLSTSEYHNIAWALKDTLEKMRELITGTNEHIDWNDECEVSYNCGWGDALKRIDAICDELEYL
jgi:hypothetical protein